ncbi:MAG: ATP-binding protein [Lachnospiraceae bacterium]|nr:ATP-binding protein [Lachnospiraceae bacterium]
MKIACLSGKGGAGKTFVAVNLASAAGKSTYIDCDVEEPNGRLFWKPEDVKTTVVYKTQPVFDADKCNGCRQCVKSCRFHALIYIKEKPMLFPEVCHNCGLCEMVCPEGAVSEEKSGIGVLEIGRHKDVKVVSGILNLGEASGIPVIHEALHQAEGMTILDCPPGSACSVMESIMDADYCVLVAEPTAFGFHNFKMVYELVRLLKKKCGVVINKQTEGYQPLEEFCEEQGLSVLERIPYDQELAGHLAKNEIASEHFPEEMQRFRTILDKIGGAK